MTQRLKILYTEKILPKISKEFQYKNIHEVPALKKIVINRGIGDASQNTKVLETFLKELSLISGQKGVVTRSKKSIAGFKIREQMPVGVSVTLRGDRMYGFLDRLIHLALPRVRDFKGINDKSFDGRGNYTMGVTEQIIFPEIDIDKVNKITGMDITFVTTANTNEEAYELLKELGMPFKNINKS